ncbi:3-ketoacyl-CoA thiolase [Striga asiatica]|uniref:3-ketoacyl-CoA thiolase n=1 Tax=Striga asiatica TaxID=4170 RepID=A0A5A7QFP4_STRAF|nr:3-ketoacyl-CoA thiolase [Striga asiatica]
MEVPPCEALDLDDSDLPSLIRPCKRRRPSSSPASKPLSLPSSAQSPEQPPPCAARRRTIPGPAGAVQAAILSRDMDRENRNVSNPNRDSGENFNGGGRCDGVIPTQDYIRRAMEDTSDFDDDFNSHPWISALKFLGAKDGVVKSKAISAIKKCLNGEKVDKVVAVIKSCAPNGLGGLVVSLKDPTGTVGASIHHKVLSGSEFGKKLTIGSVLILQKVAVFAPARSAHYLNITLGNLVQVFCQDGASTSKLYDSANPIQYADPDDGIDASPEHCGKVKTQHLQNSENLQNRSVTETQNLLRKSVQFTQRAPNNISRSQKELISLSPEDALDEIQEDGHRNSIAGNCQEFVKGDNLSDFVTNNMNNESVARNGDQEIQGISTAQTQSQLLKTKASLPEWTDEQLDELFAGDDDEF